MQLIRANIAHFPHATTQFSEDITIIRDGGVVIDEGKIIAVDSFTDVLARYPKANVIDRQGQWLLPGFIDSHLHYPQTQSIASYGDQLLSWLENYTFPTEKQFADEPHAQQIAQVFLRQLLKNGTTTGFVFCSVHQQSCEALFSAASELNMAIVAGKVCMDRNCPQELEDCPTTAQVHSAALIDKWHNHGRNKYAITPRFAPTSSEAQLASLGELASQYPDVFVQTHLSENLDEIAWVKRLFPTAIGYLDVYDKYNMVRPRAVFGHGIHLNEDEWQRLHEAGSTIAFCPTSNLFLGSGLFDIASAKKHDVHVALATDVGAGTSFSMLKTYADAYKVSQLRHTPISPFEGFYLMTQGAAVAHQMESDIGNLNPGSSADFVVLDHQFDELTSLRIQPNAEFDDVFFALSILGDDRAIRETWVNGRRCYEKKESSHAMV
ncbi:guanine deaminase [Alteromonas sp. 345S023]|uniref:Guanine deaminase n=1 Tax=Alteromonas profundi TaxID=2696062 RepID=A0A7X5RJU0_9ALTE|nr:guanine deaminase [Alteromonas profundi]NDV89909.1 guanine deaminase [Alteromonas profundi]